MLLDLPQVRGAGVLAPPGAAERLQPGRPQVQDVFVCGGDAGELLEAEPDGPAQVLQLGGGVVVAAVERRLDDVAGQQGRRGGQAADDDPHAVGLDGAPGVVAALKAEQQLPPGEFPHGCQRELVGGQVGRLAGRPLGGVAHAVPAVAAAPGPPVVAAQAPGVQRGGSAAADQAYQRDSVRLGEAGGPVLHGHLRFVTPPQGVMRRAQALAVARADAADPVPGHDARRCHRRRARLDPHRHMGRGELVLAQSGAAVFERARAAEAFPGADRQVARRGQAFPRCGPRVAQVPGEQPARHIPLAGPPPRVDPFPQPGAPGAGVERERDGRDARLCRGERHWSSVRPRATRSTASRLSRSLT